MKAKLLTFIVGAACGALGMFLANRPATEDDASEEKTQTAQSIHPDREQQKIAALEKKIAVLEAEAQQPKIEITKNNKGGTPVEVKGPAFKIFGAGESKIDLNEMREHMEKMEKGRAAKRVNAKLARLTKTLGLSDEQAEQIRALLEKKEAERSDGLKGIMELATAAASDGDAKGVLSTLIPGEGDGEESDEDAFDFDAEMLALLDGDQAKSYEEYTQAREDNYIEATANRQLAQLQTSVPDLSKEQKDQAFNEFARIAREDVEKNGAPDEGGGLDIGSMMRQQRAEKTAMDGILTPEQMELYESNNQRSISVGSTPGATIIATDVHVESADIPVEVTAPE